MEQPSWRMKTRPCPFYSQGRCLFADSCNFLHSVTIKAEITPDIARVLAIHRRNASECSSRPDTPSSTHSSRSPRLNGLLLALGDVISSDSDDDEDDALFSPENQHLPPPSEEHPPHEDSFTLCEDPEVKGNMSKEIDSEAILDDVMGSYNGDADNSSRESVPSSPCLLPSTPKDTILLSPVEGTLPRPPFLLDTSSSRRSSYDSGYGDGFTSPRPFLLSPPRSPAIISTFGLLASPFGSPSARVAFSPRNPGALPLLRFHHSSDRAAANSDTEISDLDIDSDPSTSTPFDDPERTVRAGTVINDTFTATMIEQDVKHDDSEASVPLITSSNDKAEGVTCRDSIVLSLEPPEDTLLRAPIEANPTGWETGEENPTAIYLGSQSDQPEAGPSTSIRSSLQITSTRTFATSEHDQPSPTQVPRSIFEAAGFEEGFFPDDDGARSEEDTAQLAYLQGEPNDTLNSLYGIYSDLSSSPESSSSRGLLSDPVENGDIVASRPSSSRTGKRESRGSVVSQASTGQAPASSSAITLSAPLRASSPWSESSHTDLPDTAVFSSKDRPSRSREQSADSTNSKKVPFGFRPAVTMGQVNRSSLMRNRESRDTCLQTGQKSPPAASSVRKHCKSRWSQDSGYSTPPPQSAGRLKPLRLSTILNSRQPIVLSAPPTKHFTSLSITTVSSEQSLSKNPLLSHLGTSPPDNIQEDDTHMHILESTSQPTPSNRSMHFDSHALQSAPLPYQYPPEGSKHYPYPIDRCSSGLSDPTPNNGADYEAFEEHDRNDRTIRIPLSSTAPNSRPASVIPNQYALATPRPDLLFAIASNDVSQVQKVLDDGSASANDQVGPQCALAFTLCNDQLSGEHKLKTVKMLLAYGADPTALSNPALNPPHRKTSIDSPTDIAELPSPTQVEGMHPATRYHINRAQAESTKKDAVLLRRSIFRPLTRVRYDLIGQDRALEQLFKVLSIHAQQTSASPAVILFCGPSGHGKSFLAHRFASLLDVQSHTVNMTTVRSTEGLWNSLSMSPHDDSSTSTLAEFLLENEGQRCVVVLDEIEKTDKENLFSLLVPFELGRCFFEVGRRHIDVRKTIWLATSNIGHDLVFEYDESRSARGQTMTRQEYLDLTALLRNRVSTHLGASLLSRVTCVLPFVPFTLDERQAIAAEVLISIGGEDVAAMSLVTMNDIIDSSLQAYVPVEGVRSLNRAVSNQLAEHI